MSRLNSIVSCLAACALVAICGPAVAETSTTQQKPATTPVQQKPAAAPVQQRPSSAPVQQKPAAAQQLNYANQGTAQANHVFDGTKRPANPVTANTGSKPNMVGQPVYSTPGNAGFKPASPPLRTP